MTASARIESFRLPDAGEAVGSAAPSPGARASRGFAGTGFFGFIVLLDLTIALLRGINRRFRAWIG